MAIELSNKLHKKTLRVKGVKGVQGLKEHSLEMYGINRQEHERYEHSGN